MCAPCPGWAQGIFQVLAEHRAALWVSVEKFCPDPLWLCFVWQVLCARAPVGEDQLTCALSALPPNYYRKQQLLQCKWEAAANKFLLIPWCKSCLLKKLFLMRHTLSFSTWRYQQKAGIPLLTASYLGGQSSSLSWRTCSWSLHTRLTGNFLNGEFSSRQTWVWQVCGNDLTSQTSDRAYPCLNGHCFLPS